LHSFGKKVCYAVAETMKSNVGTATKVSLQLPTWEPPKLPSVPLPSSLENHLDRYYAQFRPKDDEQRDSPSARAWKWWFQIMKRCHGIVVDADYSVYQWFLDAVAQFVTSHPNYAAPQPPKPSASSSSSFRSHGRRRHTSILPMSSEH